MLYNTWVAALALGASAPPRTTRRSALAHAATAAAAAAITIQTSRPALADAPTARTDAGDGASFALPDSLPPPQAQQLADGRRLLVSVDPAKPDFNVFYLRTPIQPDYNSLGSFGSLDYVGGTLLPQCPTRICGLESDGIAGRMIEQQAVKGNYVYDYVIQQTGQPDRHLRTVMAIVPGRALLTLTAQCADSDYAQLAKTLRAVVESFEFKA